MSESRLFGHKIATLFWDFLISLFSDSNKCSDNKVLNVDKPHRIIYHVYPKTTHSYRENEVESRGVVKYCHKTALISREITEEVAVNFPI